MDSVEHKRYLILSGTSSFLAVATLFFLLVQGNSNDDIHAPLLSIFMLTFPILFISTIVAIVKFGQKFYNHFFLCFFGSLPITIGPFFLFSITHTQYKLIFFLFQIILLLFANRELVKKNWKGMYGILYALSFSSFVYFIAYIVVLWY